MNKYLLILLLMIVTFIPRLIPFVVAKFRKGQDRPRSSLVRRLEFLLKMVPYAALGALIIPGGMGAVPGKPWVSVLGLLVAGVVAFYNKNITFAITASVGAVYLGLLFF